MAEELIIADSKERENKYQTLIPQIESLVLNEPNRIANMANVAAALKETFGFFWIGFYIVEGNELVLGPFQGPIACTRIGRGKGVCGTSWDSGKTVLVPDVDEFPGHIACSSASRSEIVIPGLNDNDEVVFVLDIDSDQLNDFGSVDQEYLEKIISFLV